MAAAKILTLLIACASGAPAHEAVRFNETLEQARSQSKSILLDFHAPWCYSCYYMKTEVLATPEFSQAVKELLVLAIDVDTPEGAALKERFKVRFLPTYVVLDARGNESGRISGEQRKEDFIARLHTLAYAPAADPVQKLSSLLDSGDLKKASRLRDISSNSKAARDPRWQRASARLDLLTAVEARDPLKTSAALTALASSQTDCAFAYDCFKAQELLTQTVGQRHALTAARTALESVLAASVFVAPADRCADIRSAIEATADIYTALGLQDEHDALLKRTAAMLWQDVERDGVGKRRNTDDNLRYFLEILKDETGLDRLYPELISKYPQDYVYAYRYAKNLLERKHLDAALKIVLPARDHAYGENALNASLLHAKILDALGRHDEARAILEKTITDNGKNFPKTIAHLNVYLEESRKIKTD
ncbi:MAG: thioredoxin family protein [Elusimicrobiota bacterium]